MVNLELADLAATIDLGRRIGAAARAGDVLLLEGPLGAGKTVFVRGVAAGLGSSDDVASPTFVLVRHYRGRLTLVHADLYRLEDAAAINRLGLLELAEDGVLVVEWPERAPRLAEVAALRLALGPGTSEPARTAAVSFAVPHLEGALAAPAPHL